MYQKLTIIFTLLLSAITIHAQQATHLFADTSTNKKALIRKGDSLQKKYSNAVAQLLKFPGDSGLGKASLKKITGGISNGLMNLGGLNGAYKNAAGQFNLLSFNRVEKELNNIFSKQPVTVGNISLLAEQQNTHSAFDSLNEYRFTQSVISSVIDINGIPLNAGYQYQYNTNPLFSGEVSRYSFSFDKDKYLDNLKKKIAGKFNPEELVPKDLSVERLKTEAASMLSGEINTIREKYKGLLDAKVKELGDFNQLFEKDITSLGRQLQDGTAMKSIKEKELLLAQLQERLNAGEKIDEQSFEQLKKDLLVGKGVNEMIAKIKQHKDRWENSGLIKIIKQSEITRQLKIRQLISDPAGIGKIAKDKLNLNGLQKLFLKITKLDIGQSDASLSELTLKDYLSKGINANFLNNNKSLALIAARQPELNSIWDYGLGNNLVSKSNSVKGFTLGKGSNEQAHNHLSMLVFRQAGVPFSNFTPSTGFNRLTVVTTVNSQMNFGEKSSLAVEVSNSSSQFTNEINLSDSSRTRKSALNNLLSLKDMIKSLAATVSYRGEYSKIDLSQEWSVRYVANGYYNPGNSFLPSGAKEIRTAVRKSFLQKRMVINIRASLRDYDFTNNGTQKWISSSLNTDLKWKMRKGQFIGLRYTSSSATKHSDKERQPVSAFNLLTAEGNMYKKLGHVGYRNYFSIGFQRNRNQVYNAGISTNKSMLYTVMQTLSVGKKMIYWNTNYSHVNNTSGLVFFNTTVMSEAGCAYTFKGISLSSAIAYSAVNDWYKQLSLRQTLSGEIGKRFVMSVYVNAGKNLRLYQDIPVSPVRAEWSVQYLFK